MVVFDFRRLMAAGSLCFSLCLSVASAWSSAGLGVAGMPGSGVLGYNDCSRQSGPPLKSTIPVWDGSLDTFFDDYRPLEDIDKFVSKFAAEYSDLVTLKTIGKSFEGRPLRVMEISSGTDASRKPLLWLQGGIHAREWIATSTVLHLAYSLVTTARHEGNSGIVSSMLNEFVFAVASPINPDGYKYTWEVNRWWRKTRSTEESCPSAVDRVSGVDGNRNWGFTRGFMSDAPGAETAFDVANPCLETYEGKYAFSEPETRSIRDYLQQRQKQSFAASTHDAAGNAVAGPGYVTALLDYHSFAEMLLPPWGFSAAWPEAPDGGYMKELCNSMAAAIKSSSNRNFVVGPDGLPADPGTSPDWAYGALGVRATMTIELENHHSFCIPKDMIKPVATEQFQALKALVGHLKSKGSQPSWKFGPWAGNPPPPPKEGSAGVKLWEQQKSFSVSSSLSVSTLCGIVVGAVLSAVVALSWRKWSRHEGSSPFNSDSELE